MVSILLVCVLLRNGGGVLLLVHLSLWCSPCSAHPSAVLISAAVVSCAVVCRVMWCVGGVCLSVVFVWWGILCLLPPRRGGGWGHCGWWGGMVDEGRVLQR